MSTFTSALFTVFAIAGVAALLGCAGYAYQRRQHAKLMYRALLRNIRTRTQLKES